jgi:hypothetical protein
MMNTSQGIVSKSAGWESEVYSPYYRYSLNGSFIIWIIADLREPSREYKNNQMRGEYKK